MGVRGRRRLVSLSLARVLMLVSALVLMLGAGCGKTAAPASIAASCQAAQSSFEHGDLKKALGTVDKALSRTYQVAPDQAWRLRLLKSEILLSQGLSRDALTLLTTANQPDPQNATLAALRATLRGAADSNLQQFDLADETFRATEKMPGADTPEVQGELLLAEGRLALSRHDPAKAELLFKRGRQVAQERGQAFLANRALMNLGIAQMQQGHYAEATDFFISSLAGAQRLDAQAIMVKSAVNLGWAYRRMGDLEPPDELFQEAEGKSKELGMISDQTTALMNIAVIQSMQNNFPAAEKDYQEALQLARRLDNRQEAAYSLTDLALTAIEEHDFDMAERYNTEALKLGRSLGDQDTELFSMFNDARIAFGRKDYSTAERLLQEVVHGAGSDLGLQASALRFLANVHAELNEVDKARTYYETAVVALEKGRQSLGRDELKLSYPTKSKDFYDDYIDFLVKQKHSDEAFRVAELHRARTLKEGLGPAPSGTQTFSLAEADQAATHTKHVVLSYWIGEKNSYLWALLPHGTRFFVLPGESVIQLLVERYRAHLMGAFDGGSVANSYGEELYRILIGPLEGLIKPEDNVTIISDGPLYELNFETLIASSPKPHYWIEDVSVTNASSAVLLSIPTHQAARTPSPTGKTLLLIGDPRQPGNYPALSHAAEEMRLVEAHFPPDQQIDLSGVNATPRAYFGARPQDFALIHFVAHGTASRTNPLDPAVVLSQDGVSYNLYARDIANNKLHARLVTISACDSAGSRIYSSEGLVGLSWGFLRAGAQQVIASMWEVNDTSTPQLMDHMYSALGKGKDPASALRAAKLALLRSGTIHARPFYWAPFLLYQGIHPG